MSVRGAAFMTVLVVLTDLESTLPFFCLSYKVQQNEATVAGVTVFAVSAVMAVSVMRAPPLKLNPPFSVILRMSPKPGGNRDAEEEHKQAESQIARG